MKTNPKTAYKADHQGAARPTCTLLAAAVLCLAQTAANAADPGGAPLTAKQTHVTLEPIPGGTTKRIILSAKAAERLGITLGKVGEEAVLRRQMVSGLITAAVDKPVGDKPGVGGGFGGFGQAGAALTPATATGTGASADGKAVSLEKVAVVATAPPATLQKTAALTGDLAKVAPGSAAVGVAQNVATSTAAAPPQANAPMVGDAWVLVNLSPGEWERLAKDKPARLLALSTRDKLGSEVLAQPSGLAPQEDVKRTMLAVYYTVPGKDHGLMLNSRMRVELPLTGSEDKQKVVPYSSVYYDGKGAAWVYISHKPLTYERRRIGVERISGDVAVLSDGPPIGTPIVTVGASLLFGAEIFGK